MVGESNKAEDTGKSMDTATEKNDSGSTVKKKQRGILSRIWNVLFRLHDDDFEKRLKNISKKEDFIEARMKKRSQSWTRMARNLIIFSVIFELITVGYAIMTTRSAALNWKMRASRVLPMFLLPALSSLAYSGLANFSRMLDRKDQKTLEGLRAERQAKIDELKEKRNYYIMQQLIQKYDTDPAAKAAAAAVLASKLGADSGLTLHVEEKSNLHGPTKSNNTEPSGLRNRKQLHTNTASAGNPDAEQMNDKNSEIAGSNTGTDNNQVVVGHYQPGANTSGGGWIARVAALLVGEDPTQSYALICGNCHMHNGLARKEDFPYITYYCPHCNALNKPQQSNDTPISDLDNNVSSLTDNPIASDSAKSSEKLSSTSNPVVETKGSETILSGDSRLVS